MKLPLSLIAASAMVATVSAAEPDHELSPDIARKLICLMTREAPERVTIGLILTGSAQGNAFESDHPRRVIFLHAVPGNGGRTRKTETYSFMWNAEYGWFSWDTCQESGGEVIRIWSETKGEVTIR